MFSPSHVKRKDPSNTANVTQKKLKDSPENSPSNQLTDSKSERSPERKISDFDMSNTEEDIESSQAIIEENEEIVKLHKELKDQIKKGKLTIQDYLVKVKQHDPSALLQRNPKDVNFNILHYLAFFEVFDGANKIIVQGHIEEILNLIFKDTKENIARFFDRHYTTEKNAPITPFVHALKTESWIYQKVILKFILGEYFQAKLLEKHLLLSFTRKDGDPLWESLKKNRPWTARIIIHECLVQLNQLYSELRRLKSATDSKEYKSLEEKKNTIESYLLTLLSNRELFDSDTLDPPRDLEDIFKLPVLILIYHILQPTHNLEQEHQVKFFKKILSTLKEKGLLAQLAKEKCKEPLKNLKELEKGDSFALFFSASCKLTDIDTTDCFSLIAESKSEKTELFLEKNGASKNIFGKIFSFPTRSCIIDILNFLLKNISENEFNNLIENSKEIIGDVIARFPENVAEQQPSGKMTDKSDFLAPQTQRRSSASFKPSIPQQAIKLLRDKFSNSMEKHFPTDRKPVVRLDQNSSPDEIQAYFSFGANIVKQQLEEKKQIQDQLIKSNLEIENLESSVKTLAEEKKSNLKAIEQKDLDLANLKAQVEKLTSQNRELQQSHQSLSHKAIQTIEQQNQKIQELEAEKSDMQNHIQELEQQKLSQENQITELTSALKESEECYEKANKELQQEIRRLKEQLSEKENKLKEVSEKNELIIKERNSVKAKSERLEKKCNEYSQFFAKIQQDNLEDNSEMETTETTTAEKKSPQFSETHSKNTLTSTISPLQACQVLHKKHPPKDFRYKVTINDNQPLQQKTAETEETGSWGEQTFFLFLKYKYENKFKGSFTNDAASAENTKTTFTLKKDDKPLLSLHFPNAGRYESGLKGGVKGSHDLLVTKHYVKGNSNSALPDNGCRKSFFEIKTTRDTSEAESNTITLTKSETGLIMKIDPKQDDYKLVRIFGAGTEQVDFFKLKKS